MYQCPNCGGVLKFDIASQQILCGYCNSSFDPYSIQEKEDAVQTEYFETTAFTCKQCGGEIFTVDQEAASFCSFCGSPAVLSSRLNKELRPQYLIPFKKTKEDCKKAYAKKMKYAFFAPKELKNEQYLNEFRGIYMPYWSYQLAQQGPYSLRGEKSHRSGDYIITDHYQCNVGLNTHYAGFSYDASANFYDDISEALAPFDVKQMVNFTPSYLCGFYADTADVPSEVYAEQARTLAVDATYDAVVSHPAFTGISMTGPGNSKDPLKACTHITSADRTMYPVWFLTYQNNDRVAYATVNGQTGKVVADMPIDQKKFSICSLLLAIPLFLLLNAFLTVVPSTLLAITSFLIFLVTVLYTCEISDIKAKETNSGDLGLISQSDTAKAIRKGNWKSLSKTLRYILICVLLVFCIGGASAGLSGFAVPLTCLGTIIAAGIGIGKNKGLDATGSSIGFILAIISTLIAGAVTLLHPVADYYYYFGVVGAVITIFYAMIDTIRNYNILATRKLPQNQKQGGDHRAY